MSAPQDSDAKSSARPQSELELSDFLLRLCHDLRSPLRAIRAHTELLAKDWPGPRDPAAEERFGFVASGAQNIELLVDGLASYSLALKIDRNSFQPAQMDVLLRLVLAKLRNPLREAGAEVTYDALPVVSGNPDRLSQLFEILIMNAVRHRGAEAPRIHFSAERQEAAWRFSARDNGPGIEPAYLERVFKPFERLRGKQVPGPGLGLAIARVIVERHGGSIWAGPGAGSGTAFFFTLPAVD